ncbi:MAG: hypothetical protein DMG40_05260 [Acidobacteria bacterium]|nr:MAG: hypothetical protein DMG40_05260 [Acidobacteriota bacterium]
MAQRSRYLGKLVRSRRKEQEMENAEGPSAGSDNSVQASSWKGLRDAARFWEPRRPLYNLLLFAVVVLWVVKTWPHFRSAMTLESLGIMTVLALLANVCYSAAYLAEMLIQNATSSASWNKQRWVVWVVGTLLAILFENYWIADEIYPFVQHP